MSGDEESGESAESRRLRPLIEAARGGKRKRFVLIVTLALVLYLARFAPEQIMAHMFEILYILALATAIDVIQEYRVPVKRIKRTTKKRLKSQDLPRLEAD